MKTQQLKSVKDAADIVGVQYRQLLKAVNDGTIPHYRIKKSRRLICVEETLNIMRAQAERQVHDE